MGKFTAIVLTIYLLYYVGNIVYDLFIKKEDLKDKDDVEIYSLENVASENQNNPKNIEIDETENINTPKSFHDNELNRTQNNMSNEDEHTLEYLEKMRAKFEAEEDIDNIEKIYPNQDFNYQVEIDDENKSNENIEDAEETPNSSSATTHLPIEESEFRKKELEKVSKFDFKEMLKSAETSLQVSRKDGFMVYKSGM